MSKPINPDDLQKALALAHIRVDRRDANKIRLIVERLAEKGSQYSLKDAEEIETETEKP